MSVVAHTTVVKLHLLLKIQRFVSGIYIDAYRAMKV